jgi:NADH:ubiquinone oxidoreductase subunit F (NADH-binding)
VSRLPRLLQTVNGDGNDLRSHLDLLGPLPDLRGWVPERLIDEVDRSGLRGRGGAAFPVARKMRAVADRRGPRAVVANGTEGEPASAKDRLLLNETPHLIFDGAAVAARAIGAKTVILAFGEGDHALTERLVAAADQRSDARLPGDAHFELFSVERRFVTGHESALINALSGGEAKPTFGPRPFERGVNRRPTLVQNVETLAHLGLIVRHGAAWFRETGTDGDPGSTLVTLSGAVAAPGVYEIEHGAPLPELLQSAGVDDELSAVLIGGYFGSWLPASALARVLLSPAELAQCGASLGAGVIVPLGLDTCPVAETARVADYFAGESAGQCGPCVNGLGAIADTLQQVASGTGSPSAGRDLARWSSSLAGRGACQFPDGATRFVSSALRVFAEEFEDHLRHGPCDTCHRAPVLPVGLAMAHR